MNKFFKLKAVAAGAVACAAMFVGASAQAEVYALSQQRVYNFAIGIFDGGGLANTTVNTYQYTLNNSATVNGVTSTDTKTCNQGSCVNGSPVLDPVAANVGAVTVGQNVFTPQGQAPAGATYARSDSVISTDQLTSGGLAFTDENQIAEALLNTSGTAGAVTSLLSTASLSVTFTVSGSSANTLALSFSSDQLQALGIVAPTGNPLVSSAVNATFSLTDSSFRRVGWNPDGFVGGCNVAGGFGGGAVTCTNELDPFSLNTTISSSTIPTSFTATNGGVATNLFGITLNNLANGTYTFDLSSKTQVQIQQTVPEPGSVALVGLALAGMGLALRRQKKQA